MKVIILCGGKGTRLREETEYKPKPMVDIGGKPVIWHIMKIYSCYGYNDFILPLGYKGEVIRDYFYNYKIRNNDFKVNLGSGAVEFSDDGNENNWTVTISDTGLETMKGARIKRVAEHIDTDRFMVTYGDGVSDIDIHSLVKFHDESGKIGVFTGVLMPSRFGAVKTDKDGSILQWQEKPLLGEYINGGFFVFKKEFLEYLSTDRVCDLEKEPLENLASDGQLAMYPHSGFWHCMDTYRDFLKLNKLWDDGAAPWKKS